MCPMVTPARLGGASCAHAGTIKRRPNQKRRLVFMRTKYIRKKQNCALRAVKIGVNRSDVAGKPVFKRRALSDVDRVLRDIVGDKIRKAARLKHRQRPDR